MSTNSPYDALDLEGLDLAPRKPRRNGLVSYMPGWLIVGLIVSVGVHVGLAVVAHKVPLRMLRDAFQPEPEPPQALHIVSMDANLDILKEEPLPRVEPPKERPAPTPDIAKFEDNIDKVQDDTTNMAMREVRMVPGSTPLPDDFLKTMEQPASAVSKSDLDKLRNAAGQSSDATIDNVTNQIDAAFLAPGPGGPKSDLQTSDLAEALRGSGGTATGGGDPRGFSNIDDLLRTSGPLPSSVPPLMMDSDVLFGSDQADLQPTAMTSLQKLGTLLRKHPEVVFVVEGHTDSFGSDEYNMALSQRRAESVKQWLITNMQIAPNRIQARGYGETRLMAPATGNEFEQQINRRVEIAIQTPGARPE